MGANYVEHVVRGGNEKHVLNTFKELQSDAAHEHGYSYSGEINMAYGLTFTHKRFQSRNEASEYLMSNCQKFDDALVVTYKDSKTGSYYWLIGALCSC